MSRPAIRVERLSKRYSLGKPAASFRDAVRDAAMRTFARRRAGGPEDEGTLWALDDVSFEVHAGEAVGVIGPNGAGKSTLLKLLSRITEPTSGRALITGRVASLLEVGTGFHPELTGRENIYLNGALLGMTRAEIAARFDEIVAFSEIGRFLDTPAKHYSSGMYLRLAFAVAAHLNAHVLLLDEILAVGDASFQKKCIAKMTAVIDEGRTIFFVSHNMGAIVEFCPRALHLSRGRLVADGPAAEVIEGYLRQHAAPGTGQFVAGPVQRTGPGPMRVLSVAMVDSDGHPCASAAWGEPLTFVIDVEGPAGATVILAVVLRSSLGSVVLELNSSDDRAPISLLGDRTRVRVSVDRSVLNHDDYYVSVNLWNHFYQLHDAIENCLSFTATVHGAGVSRARGVLKQMAKWEAV